MAAETEIVKYGEAVAQLKRFPERQYLRDLWEAKPPQWEGLLAESRRIR